MSLLRPYPDELVGSLLHRAERQLGIGREQLLWRLTGHRLSSHSFLITQYRGIAQACGMSPTEFLLAHSVLPYMTAYLRTAERERLISLLGGNALNDQRPTASLVRRSILGDPWLRLCPSCVEEELKKYGESFWHRAHQLCGVAVCVIHGIDLLGTEHRINRSHGIPPPHQVSRFQSVPETGIPRGTKLAIAAASFQALSWPRDYERWLGDYQKLVRQLGYLYFGEKIHGALLAHDLQAFFGEPFLARYGCQIGVSHKTRWPAKLLQESAHHATTFKYVLLEVFLEGQPVPSASRVDFKKRHKPKVRNWAHIELEAIDCLDNEVARHKAAGTRVNLEDLYDYARIRAVVKGHKQKVPRLMDWIAEFKKSPQSTRVPGRRPRR